MKVLKTAALSLLMVMFFSTANFAQKSTAKASSVESIKVISFQTSAHCASCKKTIESSLNKLSGVKSSNLNLDSKVVSVYYKEGAVTPEAIKKSIEGKGYTASAVTNTSKAKKSCCSGNKANCSGKKKSSCSGHKKKSCGSHK